MSDPGSGVSERWAEWRRGVRLDDYERRWEQMEHAGMAVHGEADFVTSLDPRPSTVLDAGCGTGRLASELARRGLDVVGVDLDTDMLDHAARNAANLTWVHGDLATVDLGRTFDVVVMAGNVMLFCRPEDRWQIVANLARHVAPNGALVAGNAVEATARGFDPDEFDRDAKAAGLVAEARFSTWERDPDDHGRYVVSVHRRPSGGGGVSRGWPGAGCTVVETALLAELDVVPEWMSPAELDRLGRMVPEHGQRWAAGRCWIRGRLGARLGVHPAEVVLDSDVHGRPVVVHRSLPEAAALSITHSDTVVAVAVRCGPVGIDVEGPPAPGDDLVGLARIVGSVREVEELAGCAREDQPRLFQRWWVRKEAVLKAQGHGFLSDPTAIHVGVIALSPPPPWHVVDLGGVPGAPEQLLAVAADSDGYLQLMR